MFAVLPKDIPLGLPAPVWLLTGIILLTFAAHILFVALMLGGTLASLFAEVLGLKNPDWDRIAEEIGSTLTVHKSTAVVLGVGPLLTINVLYTVYFYTANVLTGYAWLMIVILVSTAFLLGYLHKYTWQRLGNHKGLHISFVAGAALLFLLIPFIFLSNINLMLYPEWWWDVRSFWNALVLPNVIPRYFHFVTAAIGLTGLFFAWYFGREKYFDSLNLQTISRQEVVSRFYVLALASTGAQLFFGPFLFLTLPTRAVAMRLLVLLPIVIVLAIIVLVWLWREIHAFEPLRRFWRIVVTLTVVIGIMVYVRHNVRETAIAPHRTAMVAKTLDYMAKVREAQDFVVIPGGLGGKPASPGELLFQRTCAACHAIDRRLVGPPLAQVAPLYKGNPQGIVAWDEHPGRRRPDYPPMPPQNLPPDQLLQVAQYILEATGNQ